MNNTTVYTPHLVRYLLEHYGYIRSYLAGGMLTSDGEPIVYVRTPQQREHPLGYDPRGTPFPFHEPKHATPIHDGKHRGRSIEELHVMVLDFEAAWERTPSDDRELLGLYYLLGYSIDELRFHYKVSSRTSLHNRINRAVVRMTFRLNGEKA